MQCSVRTEPVCALGGVYKALLIVYSIDLCTRQQHGEGTRTHCEKSLDETECSEENKYCPSL